MNKIYYITSMKFLNYILYSYTKIIRHTIGGLISTLVAYISFPVIFYLLGSNDFNTSFIISSLINLLTSYTIQRFYVFKSNSKVFVQFTIFIFFAILVSSLSYLFMRFLVINYGFSILVTNTISVSIFAFLSFIVHDRITFSKKN
jgi:putative flippase GtrA